MKGHYYMKTWIVLYSKGARIFSAEKTLENMAEIEKKFCLQLIQRDVWGGEHYEVYLKR